MQNDELLNKIVDTSGAAIKDIPEDKLTARICKMAVEFDESLIEYVPTKFLTEILQGEDFAKEVIRRKIQIAINEFKLIEEMGYEGLSERDYVESQLYSVVKAIEQQLSVDANAIANEYLNELENNSQKKRN